MSTKTVTAVLTANVSGFTGAMAKASSSAKQFGSNFSSSISKSEQSLNGIARGAGLIGAGVAAGIGVAVKRFADFDSAMSNVAATGTDAKKNIDALRQAALDMGAQTSFSATEAAAGIENLAKAGVGANDILGGGLKGSLDLAAAGSLGVAEAAEIAATAVSQFNLEGKDVPHIADLLAAGAGKAQGSVQDLGLALGYVGPVAEGMGVSIEQTVGTLAEFANAGIVGEKGGTALRGVLLSLTSPSEKAAAAMKQYGIELYDANDNFIGVNGAAQELQDGLGGLDNKTRDAALGQIFGNAQITAARVLYQGGAADVDKWTQAVNDNGFAARTAAEKLNNLKGDLEGLSGAFETALISLGEGANGPLRGLVKQLTGVVNAFNDLGDGTKGTILAVAGIGAAGLLGVAGVAKLAIGLSNAGTAMKDLSTNSPRVAGALGAIGKAAGVAAAALIGLQVLGAISRQIDGNFVPSLERANSALVGLAGGTGNLDELFKFESGVVIKDKVDGLGSALQRLGQAGWADAFAEKVDTLSGTTDSVTGQIKTQFASLDTSLGTLSSSGAADKAAAAFTKIASAAALQGVPIEKVIGLFPQYAAAARASAEGAGYVIQSTQELADIMGGKLPPAMAAAIAGANGVAPANGKVASTADQAANALKKEQSALDAVYSAANKTASALLGMSGSEIAVEAAIDDATASLKTNGKSLDVNTAKGRANKTALLGIASASLSQRDAMKEAGASTKAVAAETSRARGQFISVAQSMGMSASKAKTLADKYFAIPKKVDTKVTAPGATKAKAQADGVKTAVNSIPASKTSTIRVNRINTTMNITRNSIGKQSKTGTGGITLASGGPVYGPGTATSDSIPAMLSNGEFVIRAAAVKALGVSQLEQLNAMGGAQRLATGGLVGFASGGSVNVGAISALITAIVNPLKDLAVSTAAVAKAQAAYAVTVKALAKPKAAFDRASGRLAGLRDSKVRADAVNTSQHNAQVRRVDAAARAVNTGKATEGERKRLAAERAKLARIDRDNAAEVKARNVQIAAAVKSKAAASDVYTKAAERAKLASDALKDSQAKLAEQQKAVADTARQVAEGFMASYRSQSTDAKDWIDLMRTGANDIGAFTNRIAQLRSAGLNEALIQQIIGMGATAGTEIATQIAAGGNGLVKSLNSANASLTKAADALGYKTATGVGRYASGGMVSGPGSGTSDSINARLSNGEYVVNAAATAANRGTLDAINYGRTVNANRFVNGYAHGGFVRSQPAIDVNALQRAVQNGMAGMTMTAQVNGDTVDVRIDRKLGQMVGGFTNAH